MQLKTQTGQTGVNPQRRYRQKFTQCFCKEGKIRAGQECRWILCSWFDKQPTWRVGDRQPVGLDLEPLPGTGNGQVAL